ncbi:MAG: hypothetical protein ABI927_02285 [Gaiellaceae bacterium]
MNRRRVVPAGAALAALAVVCVAAAGPPGAWTRAGKRPGSPGFGAGIARTADGVLHIVSLRRAGKKLELWQVQIGSDGRLIGSNAILRGWSTLANPALVPSADGGLRLFVGGNHSRSAANPGLVTATAPQAGAPWTLQPDPVSPGEDAAVANAGASTAKDGTPIAVWATPTGLHYRYDVDPAGTDVVMVLPGCCASEPAAATDGATGQSYVAWGSNAARASGVLVQPIGPDRVSGHRLYAPGSTSKQRAAAVPRGERVAISGRRGGGGVYVAYSVGSPIVQGVVLWPVGAPRTAVRIAAAGASHIVLAAAPDGRLWLAWTRKATIYVTRTNRAATRVEPVRAVSPPPRATSIWRVQGEGSLGPLDLVANLDAVGGTTFWHQQILPLLSLEVNAVAQQGGSTRFSFAVTDAGDPVPNATVRVGSQALTTGLAGTVVLTTTDRPLAAFASKSGYASASSALPKPRRS